MDRLARTSLGNRALVALITLFVMGFGALTAAGLKQELIPSLTIPSAFVMTTYPGASPQVVEDRVTTPIEQAVLSLQGLDSYTSTSSTGTSTVTVQVKYGSNMDQVQQQLQAAISRVKATLPAEADSQVYTGSFDDVPVQVIAVSDSGTDQKALAQKLRTIAVPALEKLPGVRQARLAGDQAQQVQITVDAQKLAANGLTLPQVSQAVQAAGGLVSGGSLSEGNQSLTVTIGQRFSSADQVKQIVLSGGAAASSAGQGSTQQGSAQQGSAQQGSAQRSGSTPKVVTLADVATVATAVAPQSSISRTNGVPSLTLAITKTPDRSTVEVSHAVTDALPGIRDSLGGNPSFTTTFDQAPFITQSIHDLLVEGGLGLAMAIVVILVFLRSLRSTLVTAVSIPVSVLLTLIGLRVAGFSLNILTLGALTIAVGRVVDDSIVVVENIKRHLSYGEDMTHAILTAVREVATAITAATITTVAVFLPIGFVSGQTGELFRPFAFTVTMALLSSLLVALTIVPVLSHWFLKAAAADVDRTAVQAEAERREHTNVLQRAYLPSLRWALRRPVVSLLVALALLVGSGALASQLKTDFLGSSGQNTVSITEKFSPALSLTEKGRRAARVEKALVGMDGVKTVQTTIGGSGVEALFSGGSGDTAAISVTTDAKADQTALLQRIRAALEPLKGDGDLVVSSSQGMGSSGDVSVVVTAPDSVTLRKANDALLAGLKDVPNATNLGSSLAANQPQVQVLVDAKKAAALGLSDQVVAASLRGVLTPTTVGKVEQPDGQTVDLVLQSGSVPVGLDELKAMTIVTLPTGPVKLSDVATVTRTSVATQVDHTDGQRSVTLTLTPTGDNLSTVTRDVRQRIADVALPAGAQAKIGGVATQQSDAFSQLGLALLAAIAIVYIVMVATFKSLVQPLLLTVSIPFAAVGAILALLLTNTPLGVPAMIGLLMLVGIVVTNAIVLIDLVNHYREQGDGIDEALVDGARRRLRPILMTAVATVFALIPMSLGLSGGGVFISKPLAIVVIGGLVSSTALTLLLVPVLYHLVEGFKDRRAARHGAAPAPSGASVATPSPSGTVHPRRSLAD